ncbi:MAG: hypothetical protein IJW40_00435 [Clostridia bacterium]|nr:hypothetical protein [Clostridia bacterium]
MKKLTRILCLLLSLLMLYSCTPDNEQNQPQPPDDSRQETTEDTSMNKNFATIIQNGTTTFRVVRPDDGNQETGKILIKLTQALQSMFNVKPEVINDYVERGQPIPDDVPEILVGQTNRTASKDALAKLQGDNEYYIGFDGTKLVLTATTPENVAYAVDAFIAQYLAPISSMNLTLPTDLAQIGSFTIPLSAQLEDILGRKLTFDYDSGDCATPRQTCTEQFSGEILYLDVWNMCMSLLGRDSIVAYDTELAVIALQGLANRESPRIFINNRAQDNGNTDQWVDGIEADLYWLYTYSTQGQYLSGATLTPIPWKSGAELDAVAELFRACEGTYRGVVVWDSDVPATMLTACTVAGVENLIPVRYDEREGSVYTLLTKTLGLEVKVNLVDKFDGQGTIYGTDLPSTGSAKNDAYLWAKVNYLDAGKTSAEYICLNRDATSYSADKLAYQAPHNTTLAGFDYLIAKQAFFFDLSGTNLGTPQNEPNGDAARDYDTFNQIMQSQYDRADGSFYQVCGWPATSDGESDGTKTEWLTVELMSSYHGVLEMMGNGFSASSNSSLFSHVPQIKYTQTAKQQDYDVDDDTILVMFYMGDYDSVAWLHNVIPVVWESEGRGQLPLCWGISGIEGTRASYIYNYMYQTATENDYFVSVNNGAGYLNPQFLLPQNKDANYARKTVPDGLDAWVEYCSELYSKYDLSMTPFINPNWLQSPSPGTTLRRVLEAFTAFSPDGLGWYNWGSHGIVDIDGTPMLTTLDGANNLATDDGVYQNLLGYLTNTARLSQDKNMLLIRQIIVDPAAINRAVKRVKEEHPEINFEVVDPYTFYEVAAERMD